MAVQFHPLPPEVFPDDARPYIARLNQELRDLFGLEGVIRNPIATRRSDDTIVRRGEVQVAVSRITPTISSVVSGISTAIGKPSLTLGTTNIVGTTGTAVSINSTIALFGTASPLGLSSGGTVGTSAFAARSDHRHPLTESLATASDITLLLTLTDSGGSVPALTPSGFTGDHISISAPSASSELRIGRIGNIGFADAGVVDSIMLNFAKTDFDDSVTGTRMINMNASNAGNGSATIGCMLGIDITLQATSASGANSNTLRGTALGLTGGATTNNNWSGQIVGHVMAMRSQRLTVGAVGDMICYDAFGSFQSANSLSLRATVTNQIGYRCLAPTHAIGGSVINIYGFQCASLTSGSTRTSYQAVGTATGTPTLAYGFHSLLHGVGTTRRSFIGDNSFECTANNFIAGTTGMGLVVKDSNDGNFYLIGTSGGVVGTSSLGTTIPAI